MARERFTVIEGKGTAEGELEVLKDDAEALRYVESLIQNVMPGMEVLRHAESLLAQANASGMLPECSGEVERIVATLANDDRLRFDTNAALHQFDQLKQLSESAYRRKGAPPGLPPGDMGRLRRLGGLVAQVPKTLAPRLPIPMIFAEPEPRAHGEEVVTIDPALRNPENVFDLLPLAPVAVEFGIDVVTLVEPSAGGDLMDQVVQMRVELALETGFVLPGVQFRDNLNLRAGEYRILVRGVPVAGGHLAIGYVLALDPPQALAQHDRAVPSHEPLTGQDAVWLPEDMAPHAAAMSCMLLLPQSVILQHLRAVAKGHACEILSYDEVELLLEKVAMRAPAVVRLARESYDLSEIHAVLAELLRQGKSIRDLPLILQRLCLRRRVAEEPTQLVSDLGL
ncbi:Flagellar biosynthesis protein FlhA [compost metagenome]